MQSNLITQPGKHLDQNPQFPTSEPLFESARRRLIALAARSLNLQLKSNTSWQEFAGAIRTARPDWPANISIDEVEGLLVEEIKSRATDGEVTDLKTYPGGAEQRAIAALMRGRSYLPIPSCTPYFAAQSAIAKRDQFRPDDRHWPTTRIETRDGVTSIQLRPLNLGASLPAAEQEALIDQMWVLRDQLSPLDADVLDGLFGVWINSAKTPADDVLLYIDDLLGLRGLQKKLSKTGRRGGYREEQRTEIIEAIGRVESVWIEFQAADTPHNRKRKISIIESRAITVSDRCGQRRLDGGLDVRAVLFRPGRVFGAYLFGRGRQVALLATRALRFDPYRQRPEKDLTRYLARQWRVRARAGNYYQPFKIESLLNESSISLSKNDPRRAKHRLETALDTLETEGIISEWHYSGGGWGDDSFTERRGWLGEWLQATVEIETPDAIRDHYAGIEVEREYPQPTQPKPADIGTQLAHERHRLQISQTYTAERLGITPSALSRIEKGKRTPGKTLLTKIGNLLNEWAQIEGGIERL